MKRWSDFLTSLSFPPRTHYVASNGFFVELIKCFEALVGLYFAIDKVFIFFGWALPFVICFEALLVFFFLSSFKT